MINKYTYHIGMGWFLYLFLINFLIIFYGLRNDLVPLLGKGADGGARPRPVEHAGPHPGPSLARHVGLSRDPGLGARAL